MENNGTTGFVGNATIVEMTGKEFVSYISKCCGPIGISEVAMVNQDKPGVGAALRKKHTLSTQPPAEKPQAPKM